MMRVVISVCNRHCLRLFKMFTNTNSIASSTASSTPSTFSFINTAGMPSSSTGTAVFGSTPFGVFGSNMAEGQSFTTTFGGFSPPRSTAESSTGFSQLLKQPAWGSFQAVKKEGTAEPQPAARAEATSNVKEEKKEFFSTNPFLTAKLFGQAGLKVKRDATNQQSSSAVVPMARKERKGSGVASLSPEELSRATILKMPLIPIEFNNQQFLMRHFRHFGNVVQIKCSPRMGVATVEFDNHISAKTAKEQGAVLKPNTDPVKILWTRQVRRDRLSDVSDEIAAHSAALPRLEQQRLPKTEIRRSVFGGPLTGGSVRAVVKRISADKPVRTVAKVAAVAPKMEGLPSNSSTQPTSDVTRSIVTELRALIGRHAKDVGEKWKILDERDKILRKARRQKTEVGHGNCPDMCPEKERYQREVRNQVSPYEGQKESQKVMDPVRAVKDYSRSAADQEEPLPHDMRPSSVLRNTMDYLLANIIRNEPPPDSELLNWFDFLWTRTRAIRKDLTQQEIVDMDAVELFEQITRLHIYVAHWLSFFEPSDFDQKMNTENLSKCLQSLNQLYEDLAKRGRECPNEPEFRSYQILLNLNDSNVLRQALNWPLWVRESSVVRFALRLCCAVQNSNFVQVFRLIHTSATYLQACFSHRYFHQMRKTALLIMVRAYGMNQEFPIDILCDWLGFEDATECLTFVTHFNLTASDQDGSYVLLNKTSFAEPESGSLSVQRSFKLVESKRTGSLAELIRGSPVPRHEVYHPIDSFDTSGNYTNDPVIQSYLETLHDQFAAEEENERVNRQQREQQKLADRAAAIAAEKQRLEQMAVERERALLEVQQQKREQLKNQRIQRETHQLAAAIIETVETEEVTKAVVQVASTELLEQLVENLIRDIVKDYHSVTRTKMDTVKESSLKAFYTILYEVSDGTVVDVCRKELRSAKRDRVDTLSTRVIRELLEAVLEESVTSVTRRVFQTDVVERLAQLALMKKRRENKRILTAFHRWKMLARKSAKRKVVLAGFPISPHTGDAADCVNQLGLKRRRVSDPFALRSQLIYLNQRSAQTTGMLKVAWKPLNLHEVFNKPVVAAKLRRLAVGNLRDVHFYKLLLLYLTGDSNAETYRWINTKFRLDKDGFYRETHQLDYKTQRILEVKRLQLDGTVKFGDFVRDLQQSDGCVIVCDGRCHIKTVYEKFRLAEQAFFQCGRLQPVGMLVPADHRCRFISAVASLHDEKLLNYCCSGTLEDNFASVENCETLNQLLSNLVQDTNRVSYCSSSLGNLIKECFVAYVCHPASQQLEPLIGVPRDISDTIWYFLRDLITRLLQFIKIHSVVTTDIFDELPVELEFSTKEESLAVVETILGNVISTSKLRVETFSGLIDSVYDAFGHQFSDKLVVFEQGDFEQFQREVESEPLSFSHCNTQETEIEPETDDISAILIDQSSKTNDEVTFDPEMKGLLVDLQREINSEKLKLEDDQRLWAELLSDDFPSF